MSFHLQSPWVRKSRVQTCPASERAGTTGARSRFEHKHSIVSLETGQNRGRLFKGYNVEAESEETSLEATTLIVSRAQGRGNAEVMSWDVKLLV